jgi:hypothetical protein
MADHAGIIVINKYLILLISEWWQNENSFPYKGKAIPVTGREGP